MTVDSRWASLAVAAAFVPALAVARSTAFGDTGALSLHATITGAATAGALTISLSRWSTDAERAPLVAAFAAFAAPPPPPPAAPAPPGAAAGRGRGRGAPPPPPSPFARLSTAIKAAPTLGYIWTDGVTGYSIKYAWRSPTTGDKERIVLVTDRRLDSHVTDVPASSAAADAEFTVIEMRIDRQGAGEGKTSLTTRIAIDAETKTLALDGYGAAPASLKVTR
jgi:hypothetical protein